MARYELIKAKEEAQATGKVEKISVAKMQDIAIQRQIAFLVKATAVKGSVKIAGKYERKFSLVWQNKTSNLFHQQSYTPYIASDGGIRCKGNGNARVSVENPLTMVAKPKVAVEPAQE